jgi:hypothetical protein
MSSGTVHGREPAGFGRLFTFIGGGIVGRCHLPVGRSLLPGAWQVPSTGRRAATVAILRLVAQPDPALPLPPGGRQQVGLLLQDIWVGGAGGRSDPAHRFPRTRAGGPTGIQEHDEVRRSPRPRVRRLGFVIRLPRLADIRNRSRQAAAQRDRR